jgi:hypothetical protein
MDQVKQLPPQRIAHRNNHDIYRYRETLAQDEIVAGRVKNSDPLIIVVKLRTHAQPAFFSPQDDFGSLDDCCFSAYSKRFLSSCARISADERDG